MDLKKVPIYLLFSDSGVEVNQLPLSAKPFCHGVKFSLPYF